MLDLLASVPALILLSVLFVVTGQELLSEWRQLTPSGRRWSAALTVWAGVSVLLLMSQVIL